MKRFAFALALVALAGCSTYVPARLEELPVGKAVRVRLDAPTSADLPPISGLSADRVAGTLVRRSSTEVVIHVPVEIGSPIGQDLIIPAQGVVFSEILQPNQGRTMLALAAGVGLLVGAILATQHGGAMSEAPGDNTDHEAAFTSRPGTSRTSIPLISFSVP
jgi:hypothetical protein